MQRDALFSAFESLGNNCELGFVQDAAGCKSLSLFKNVGFDRTEQIIDALEAGLEGMFEPGAYAFAHPSDWPDYALDCHRFGFRFHTGLAVTQPDAERHFDSLLTAFRWLRGKFLDDLRAGVKVFTYRHQLQFDPALAERLAAAIRGYGPGWLLWVRADDRPDRCFAWVERGAVEGLLLGGMPHLVAEPPPRVAYDAWEQIARQALRLRDGQDVPESPTNAAVRPVTIGTWSDPVSVQPNTTLVAHSWVWLPPRFAATHVAITADGAVAGQGQPVDTKRHESWQPVWTLLRVNADRTQVRLGFTTIDGAAPRIYTTGWTIRHLNQTPRPRAP
ncbi:hypothetical protein [Rhodopila sp.]|jgi:hypothetical protein|uniref:hypothetical protein n=1 Tax=Rhodopila sp. TaxID=2480087 RepID=UPI002C3D7FF9|nr:hypothetical protein [Rhodopila sp.]HVZ09677.1 hypothetical protein [Rhodopila sp.]